MATACAAPRKLEPVDEAGKDPSFSKFRTQLRKIVARRDGKELLKHVSPDVKYDDKSFAEYWKLDEPTTSRVWVHLDRLLRRGGKLTQPGTFVAPYVWAGWPKDVGRLDYGVIVGENVNVRAQPDLKSSVLTGLSEEIVALGDQGLVMVEPDESWVQIKLPKPIGRHRHGYVSGQYFASPIDFRAVFTRANDGTWKMTAFEAGEP